MLFKASIIYADEIQAYIWQMLMAETRKFLSLQANVLDFI